MEKVMNAKTLRLNLILLFFSLVISCRITSHKTIVQLPAEVYVAEKTEAFNKLYLNKIKSANWQAKLSGLLDLDDKKSKNEELRDRIEPVEVYFYVLEHPKYGTYLIDSGVEHALKEPAEDDHVGFMVKYVMGLENLKVHQTMKEWLESYDRDLEGLFLTHLHVDHILGLPDLPKSINIYAGPGEVTASSGLKSAAVRLTTNKLFEGHRPIQELDIEPYEGFDFFGDRSLLIYSVPGHTKGSLAFLVHAQDGKHLVTGDTCHTVWGWEHGVAPGDFTEDRDDNRKSLSFLKKLVESEGGVKVHLGHQSIE